MFACESVQGYRRHRTLYVCMWELPVIPETPDAYVCMWECRGIPETPDALCLHVRVSMNTGDTGRFMFVCESVQWYQRHRTLYVCMWECPGIPETPDALCLHVRVPRDTRDTGGVIINGTQFELFIYLLFIQQIFNWHWSVSYFLHSIFLIKMASWMASIFFCLSVLTAAGPPRPPPGVVVVVVAVVVVGQNVGSISSRTLAFDCLCTLELCTASMIATS